MRNKRLIIIFSILLSITVIVLLGSIIFSVKMIDSHCENYLDAAKEDGSGSSLNQRVLDNVKLSRSQSIFLINDKKIIEEVEKNVPDVRVINLERKFPDRLTVNYVKLFNYFEVKIEDTYYQIRYDGVVTGVSGSQSETPLIRVVSGLNGLFKEGDELFSGKDQKLLIDATAAAGRIGLNEFDFATLFDFIDITRGNDIVYFGFRNTGNVIKIFGREDIFSKLRLSVSLFNKTNLAPNEMIIVAGSGNSVNVTRSNGAGDYY